MLWRGIIFRELMKTQKTYFLVLGIAFIVMFMLVSCSVVEEQTPTIRIQKPTNTQQPAPNATRAPSPIPASATPTLRPKLAPQRILTDLAAQYEAQGIEVSVREEDGSYVLSTTQVEYRYLDSPVGEEEPVPSDQERILAYASEEEAFAVIGGSLSTYDREQEEFVEVELPEGGKNTGSVTYLGRYEDSLFVLDENLIASHQNIDGEWMGYERPVYFLFSSIVDESQVQELIDNPLDIAEVKRLSDSFGEVPFGFHSTHSWGTWVSFVPRSVVTAEDNGYFYDYVVMENPSSY